MTKVVLPKPLDWKKCDNGVWCDFMRMNLNSITIRGIYWIWCDGEYNFNDEFLTNTVYIGQGNISERIFKHRRDSDITEYSERGRLLVTWAHVIDHHMDAVEGFFCNSYKPLAVERCPDCKGPVYIDINGELVLVNTPFD